MTIENLLDISTREGLYQWYLDNHDKAKEFWIRDNRAAKPFPGIIDYIDAVEVTLCFGWMLSKLIPRHGRISSHSPRITSVTSLIESLIF